MSSTSTFVIRWINFLTMVKSNSFPPPCSVIVDDRVVLQFLVSLPSSNYLILAILVVGFGLWMSTHHDECKLSLTIPVMALGGLIFLMFIITTTGSGHAVAELRYKEYRLQDYSSWFIKQLNNTENWSRLRSCLVKSDDCNGLAKRYKTLKEYRLADLTPIEAGCCRPPSECGYPAVNASYFDLSYHPVSTKHGLQALQECALCQVLRL